MKAVWLENSGKNYSLASCILTPTPTKGMQSDSPLDQEVMAQAVHKLVSDAKITTKFANMALTDNQAFLKVIDMPMLSDKELASAIQWEAEQHIPSPLSTMTLAWHVLRSQIPTESGPKMQILLVAAPTLLIKRYQRIVGLAGLTIASIETEILSVVRSVVSSPSFPTSLVIHIGALSTSFAIVQNGLINFTYSIPLGGIAINRAIASDFGFSIQQAEEYKKIYGIGGESMGEKIGKAIDPILASIISEIKKAVAYHQEKFKNESAISQIVLSGGTAQLPGIDRYFVSSSGLETVIGNPWSMREIQQVPKDIMSNGVEFAVAVGLAIKEHE